uniref:RdRp n=1 Tax=Downy mildew lesion associated splipalmivirus 46 TaxID=3065434 RepID=A0AA49X5E3_9VIRU|nr:MAG: putative RdRp [Plasmopara viticola lesion associated narnavirus 46]
MNSVQKNFPAFAGCVSPIYDDEYITQLIDRGQELFAVDTASKTLDTSEIFPKGKPFAPKGAVKEIDSEVGDDLIVVSNNVNYLLRRIDVLNEYLDLKISWKDTSINQGIGNFSECLVRIPRTYPETWLSQKSIKVEESFGFIDVPKIRHMLPVRNMRMIFSSTNVGKFIDMGKNVTWHSKKSPYYATMTLGSLIQDAILGSAEKDICPYLPQDFGGCGKEIPFRNQENLLEYFHVWKNGKYLPIITTVIRELNKFIQDTNTFKRIPKVPLVLEHFTKWDPVYYDWIKDENHLMTAFKTQVPDEYSQYSLGTIRFGEPLYNVAPKLLREGYLVSETKLQVAIQHNALSSALVSADTMLQFRQVMEKARRDWRENHRFGEYVLNNEDFKKELDFYSGNLRRDELYRFVQTTSNVRDLRRLIQSERVYYPEALDKAYLKGPMLLKKMWLRPQYNGRTIDVIPREPLLLRTSEEQADIESLYEWVQGPRTELPPAGGIEDDDNIIMMAKKLPMNHLVVIITDDIRLCRRCALETGRETMRIPTEFYYRQVYFNDGIEDPVKDLVKQIKHIGPWTIIEDTGSIQSAEERNFKDGEFYPKGAMSSVINYNKHWSYRPPAVIGQPLDFERLLDPPEGFPQRCIFSPRRIKKRGNNFTWG